MQLRADEAAVVEKAVRLAIESVMNVLCAVNSARTHELQRLVAERERQIQLLEARVKETERLEARVKETERLEARVKETEAELQLLLRARSPSPRGTRVPEQEEIREEQREGDLTVSVSLLTGPSSDPSDGPDMDQTPPRDPGASEAESSCPTEEAQVREPPRPAERAVKQERLGPSPARVKVEPPSPDYGPLLREVADRGELVFHSVLGHAEPWQSVSSQAEESAPLSQSAPSVPQSAPARLCGPALPHSVPWRSRAGVSRREQSEEAMRRRRASWRAASRRYYARKMARLQSHAGVTSHTRAPFSGASSSGLPYAASSTGPPYGGGASVSGPPYGSGATASGPPYGSGASTSGPPYSSGASSSGPPYGSGASSSRHVEPWRFPVCELAPPPSSDLTFMTESELLNGSFSINDAHL